MNNATLTDRALDKIFRMARTGDVWQNTPVRDETLHKIHDLMKFGPTSANCSPLRIVFVKTPEGKALLKPTLMPGNIDKTMSAPVTAIFAHDMRFYEHLPFLFPHTDAKAWFTGNDPLIAETAFRNGTLQAAYFIIAARAYGLDCGPMSGFDKEKVDREFFKDGRFKSNFLCNLGYADTSKQHSRSPRFRFEDTSRIV